MNNDFEKDNQNSTQNTNPFESNASEVANETNTIQDTSPATEGTEDAAQVIPSKKEDSPDTYSYRWNYDDYQKQEQQKAKGTKSKGLRIFAVSVAAVFVLSFATLTGVFTAKFFAENNATKTTVSEQKNGQISAATTSSKDDTKSVSQISTSSKKILTIPEIAAKCQPSSVGIMVNVKSEYGMTSQGVGSGFVYSKDGYIITNAHVVENASDITVVLNDKSEVKAKLIGSDSLSDLAVLKIDKADLTPMDLGDSDDVVVGDLAVAIGSPAGIEYTGSVTDGIISAINRDVEIYDNYGRIQKTMTLIQTNATVNRGNSGGPLINKYGEVIGINTLKLTSDFEGMGFSIPMNGAKDIITQLIQNGKVSDRGDTSFASSGGSIGITQYADISAEESKYYDIPEGVFVIQLQKDCNAAKAGLRRGDIITKYNGTVVKTADEINKLKAKSKAGDEAKITVYRDGEGELQLTFKLNATN